MNEKMTSSWAHKLFRGTLCLTVVALLTLLLIDWLFPSLWILAGFIYFWTFASLYLGIPLCILFAAFRASRRDVGLWVLVANIIAAGLLAVVVQYSNAIDAVMRV